jgi:hypothetical protein
VVPPSSDRIARVPPYSRTTRRAFPYGALTRSGPTFQTVLVAQRMATGLVRFRSPLLAESRLMSFPPATEMFQFAGFASPTYGFSRGYPRNKSRGGLPHSEICGSTSARLSPQLFAACHVLRRLLAPRHPPNALTSTLDRKTRRSQGQAPLDDASRMKTLFKESCQPTAVSSQPSLFSLFTLSKITHRRSCRRTCFSRSRGDRSSDRPLRRQRLRSNR